MITYINRIITNIKGENFEIDAGVPVSYVFRLLFTKFIALLYGNLRFVSLKRVFIHPRTTIKCSSKIFVGKNFSVAEGCYIDALSKVGLQCGNNVSVGYNTHIELTGSLKHIGQGMIVGDNVGLGTHGHYGSGMGLLVIGNDTIFGNYVSIHPENHNYLNKSVPIRLQGVNGHGVRIGNNCWIGAKVTILDGSIIGDNSIVAAGAVVKGVFPNNVIIGGIPAKIIKEI